MTRTPILRIVCHNAFVLSVLYVLTGIGVDLAWRFHPSHFIFRLSFALDALPAQALALLGLLGPLQQANFRGSLTPIELRWIFSAAAIAVIFGSALVIGCLMAITRKLWERPQQHA